MAAAELEVIIGANTKGIEDGANRAERALTNIGKSIQKLEKDISANIVISKGYGNAIEDLTTAYNAGDISQKKYSQGIKRLQRDEKETQVETKRLTAELRNLKTEQKQLSVGLNTGAGAMNKFGKSTSANAVPAMTSFSQVMQDAPYGIQGVANNIQQLTMQFGYLQKSAGGTKAALKAMLSSLAGPAGILLAVSLVTTLLVAFGDKLFSSGEKAETAAEKLEKYIDSLKGVNRAQLDASVSAAKEIIQLRMLSAQATNSALSNQERITAVNELRKLYPSYLKGMTDEQILANGLTTAYNAVTDSIMRKARAEAASEIMVENEKKRFKLVSKLSSETSKAAEAQKILNEYAKDGSEISRDQYGMEIVPSHIIKASKAVKELTENTKDLNGQIQSIELENIDLQEAVTAKGDLIIDPETVKVNTGGKGIDPIRVPITPIVTSGLMDGGNVESQAVAAFKEMLTTQLEMQKKAQDFFPEFSQQWKDLAADIAITEERLSGFAMSLAESGKRGGAEFTAFAEQFLADNEAIKMSIQETEAQANIFASAVGGAIGGLGDLLADSLSKNGSHFQKFGGIIIKTATEVLSQLAQTAIKQLAISQAVSTGQAVQAGTQTAAASGPAAAIVLPGIVAAMVAIVGSAFSGIAAFNFGGFVGDNNLVRMNGNERILTAGEANTFNNLMMNRDVGMSGQRMQVDVAVQGRLSGEDILISGTRTQTRKNRLG